MWFMRGCPARRLLLRHRRVRRLVREVEVRLDLPLHDLFDGDLEVAAAGAVDHGAGAVHELNEPALDEGAQLEPAAGFGDDFVALECFDHWGFSR